jgi:hypothetical protein
LREDDRDLSLAEGAVERVVDGLHQDVQTRGLLAIHIDTELKALRLLIAGGVDQFRKRAELFEKARRPFRQASSARPTKSAMTACTATVKSAVRRNQTLISGSAK